MGQALYRKHRSKNLTEIVGQEHITTALEQALSSGRVSHAYLFTGPRGTGKTSIARILAHAVNELPYSSKPHLDIIEIDAASNRRIDEIRDLRDKVYIAPASAKYKVYIIDEVHMLTREAFNALLKTLEEPPAHVIFILATTDAHKLPETIVSRTQRYNFRPVDKPKVVAHLKHIAKQEGIKIDDDALELLAEHGEGSFRDSISMLDQASNHAKKITLEAVRQQLGIPPTEAVSSLISHLNEGSIAQPVQDLQQMFDNGYRAPAIAEQLSQQIRTGLTTGKSTLPPATALTLLKNLLDVASAHNPDRHLELVLMQAIIPAVETVNAPQQNTIHSPPATPVMQPIVQDVTPTIKPDSSLKTAAIAKSPMKQSNAQVPKEKPNETPVPQPTRNSGPAVALDDEVWKQVLAELKKQYNTLYGIVRMAQTDFSESGKVTLGFGFAFHQKRIHDAKNRKIVIDTITHVTGQHVELICIVSKDKAPAKATATPDNALKDISNVFGGGELL